MLKSKVVQLSSLLVMSAAVCSSRRFVPLPKRFVSNHQPVLGATMAAHAGKRRRSENDPDRVA
ncbi:MAG: hypothetical protein WA970_10660 [Gammaproteobacteria bacterium]